MSAAFNQRVRELEPRERCPACSQQTVYYLGTDVLHGNPYTPASDTEVEHQYECGNPACRHRWSHIV